MLSKTPIVDTYLSAAELGITEKEREALIWVRTELAEGRIEHDEDWFNPSIPNGFNMRTDEYSNSCGTVRCIGGWMREKLSQDGLHLSIWALTFKDLFLPDLLDGWSTLTPAQAVRAIDAWATGNQSNCWQLALEAEDA